MGVQSKRGTHMNRTRSIFLLALAACLLILTASLARQVISADRLLQIYIASTIFAGGVVLLDVAGVLGGHHADGFAGNDMAGHDFGGHDAGGHDTGGHDGVGDAHTAPVHADQHEVAEHTARAGGHAAPILSILAYLRLLVYFCLGFGPAGWAALIGGWGALSSLLLAVPIGLLALLAARAFFRFQRRDTGAVPPELDLLHEQAEVIVPLDD